MEWSGGADSAVGLPQDTTGLRIDVPADRGAVGIDVDDPGIHVTDFLGAGGGEGELGIVHVLCDEGQVALDLLEALLALRRGDLAYLALRRHERKRGSEHDRHRTHGRLHGEVQDRKSTRLNSSHGYISYAVFCLKKKKKKKKQINYTKKKNKKKKKQ